MGSSNGSWVSWYGEFAAAPLVIGYNPNSAFASAFKTKPWWQVLTSPNILIGRTDPVLDPKGVLTIQFVNRASKTLGIPNLFANARLDEQQRSDLPRGDAARPSPGRPARCGLLLLDRGEGGEHPDRRAATRVALRRALHDHHPEQRPESGRRARFRPVPPRPAGDPHAHAGRVPAAERRRGRRREELVPASVRPLFGTKPKSK